MKIEYDPGTKIGDWTVLSSGHRLWRDAGAHRCRCICGMERLVCSSYLRSGISTNCGCRRRFHRHSLKHGKSKSKEYRAWTALKTRCSNTNSKSYSQYGGRGITVCDRWKTSFENFYSDLGPAPGSEFSIERMDTQGHYEPRNCVWATARQQANNKRNNLYVKIDGETMTLTQASRIFDVPHSTLSARWHRGMPIRAAVSIPVRELNKTISANGKTLTKTEWCKELGISRSALDGRIKTGYSPEEAVSFGCGGNPKRSVGRGLKISLARKKMNNQ